MHIDKMLSNHEKTSTNIFFLHLFYQLAEKYGNIFSLRRGLTKVVYVSGYKLVKEALVSESFARCVSPLFDDIYKGRGEPI